MTEGNGRSLGSEASLGQEITDTDVLNCPVCGDELKSLRKLNAHLDTVHGFNDGSPSDTDVDSSRESSVIGLNTLEQSVADKSDSAKPRDVQYKGRYKIKTSHWKKPVDGKSHCFQCNCKITGKTGAINCRKCGEIFCLKHCRNAIKLNENSEYDPIKGMWCKCCRRCFTSREGYNDFGYYRNITEDFLGIRKLKNEDGDLIALQLENRLLNLINGIIKIYLRHMSSIIGSMMIRREVHALERSIVEWKDDRSVSECYICSNSFQMLMRKHHCRLCGQVVCDRVATRCSSDIPVLNLMSAAPDLSFESIANIRDISQFTTCVRVCSLCLRSVYAKRKLEFQKQSPLPSILQEYENLHNLEVLVTKLLPQFNECVNKIHENTTPDEKLVQDLAQLRRKLLQNLTLYDKISKKLIHMDVHSQAELKIQQSIASHASTFIEEKMLPLKRIPDVFTPASEEIKVTSSSDLLFNNLTIAEVKRYREELMVLKEQRYLVETMLNSAATERRFEEAITLKSNLAEIDKNVKNLESRLGDEGFD